MNDERRKQIDEHLRKITPSEADNRLGIINRFEGRLPLYVDDHFGNSNRFIPLRSDTPILLKKNSRFRTVDEHRHDFIEIGYIYSGSVSETIDRKNYVFHQGQMILIDRNTAHAIGYTDENDILVSILAPIKYCHSALNRIQTDNVLLRFFLNALNDENKGINYLIFNTENQDRIQEMILEMIYEQIFPSQNHNEIMESLFQTVILSAMSMIDTEPVIQNLNKSSAAAVSAVTYIDQHYKECTLQSTADHLGINAAYLSTLLKKEIGKNFRDIVSEKKLRDAAEMLRTTDTPVSVIAESAGYPNLTLFYRKFQEQYGSKPAEYRKALKQMPDIGI
ncbi:MAG: AraC family transcriptional regulator [Solobacterium sp.]|nr:AraC family transcriptional regulator [Solobacterium sp.]